MPATAINPPYQVKFSEFINRLVADTGLHKDVVTAWVGREQGVNNNVLGITGNGGLLKFSSQTQAADATARLLANNSQYQGIMNSVSGTSAQQALAIAKSPWRLGGAGLKAAGGTDPYYLQGFINAGILGGSSTPSGGASTPITLPNPINAVGTTLGLGGLTGSSAVTVNPSDPLGIGAALKTPFFFLGIVIVGAVLIFSGALVSLKGKMPSVMPIPV